MKNNFQIPFIFFTLFWALIFTVEATCQSTYWMERKVATENKTYYDIQVPSFFGEWIDKYGTGGKNLSHGGKNYDAHIVQIMWDNSASCPKKTGQININNNWPLHDKNSWGSFVDALYSLGGANTGWTNLGNVKFIKTQDATPPGLVIAHDTYWMEMISTDGRVISYDKRVPHFFGKWIEKHSPTSDNRTFFGKTYQFHSVKIKWDNNGSSPKKTGQININDEWPSHDKNNWGVFMDALYSKDGSNTNWTDLGIVNFIKTQDVHPPGLTIRPKGAPFSPALSSENFPDFIWNEYFMSKSGAPQIISQPSADGSFDVVWQDLFLNSKKILISNYRYSGGKYVKDSAKSKTMDGLGFLAGFAKDGDNRYIMTGERWINRGDRRKSRIYKNDNVLWEAKVNSGGSCQDVDALTHFGTVRLALGMDKLMVEMNTAPAHAYQEVLDVNSGNKNSGKCATEALFHHIFDNDVLFDGTNFVVMENMDHDVGIGMMKFSPSENAPFTGHADRIRSVYAHTNFGNSTYIELGDMNIGLNGGYLVLFTSERDWDNKMVGYTNPGKGAPGIMSPRDVALVHVKKDFDKEEVNWKNSAGTSISIAPKVVDNRKVVNSIGSGKTVNYPSANDGWNWNTYNCCGIRDEINAGMKTRQQITSGVKWLTGHGTPFENARREGNKGEKFTNTRYPKLVKISSNEYIVMWEEHIGEVNTPSHKYLTTKALKVSLSANGDKVDILTGSIKDIGQARLMPDDDAFELSGKAAWVIGDRKSWTLKLYTLDANLNLSTFDLEL